MTRGGEKGEKRVNYESRRMLAEAINENAKHWCVGHKLFVWRCYDTMMSFLWRPQKLQGRGLGAMLEKERESYRAWSSPAMAPDVINQTFRSHASRKKTLAACGRLSS